MGLIMDLKNKLNEDNASNDNIILAQATPSTDTSAPTPPAGEGAPTPPAGEGAPGRCSNTTSG